MCLRCLTLASHWQLRRLQPPLLPLTAAPPPCCSPLLLPQASEELQQRLSQQEATASQLKVELAELTKSRAQAQQQMAAAEEKVGLQLGSRHCLRTYSVLLCTH